LFRLIVSQISYDTLGGGEGLLKPSEYRLWPNQTFHCRCSYSIFGYLAVVWKDVIFEQIVKKYV